MTTPTECTCATTDTYRQIDRACPVHGDRAELLRRSARLDASIGARLAVLAGERPLIRLVGELEPTSGAGTDEKLAANRAAPERMSAEADGRRHLRIVQDDE